MSRKFGRLLAEHEAAHAVVALACGMPVREVRIDQPTAEHSGHCAFEPRPSDVLQSAAVSVAPRIWLRELRGDVWPASTNIGDQVDAEDVTRLVVELTAGKPVQERLRMDQWTRATVNSLARRILQEQPLRVMAVADGLERHGVWTNRDGWAGQGLARPRSWDEVAQQLSRDRKARMARRERLNRRAA